MVAGSYDASMVGCATVIPVARPFFMIGSKKKIREKLIDPAVRGVEHLLASCSKTPSVTRVVLTGTVLAASCDSRAYFKDKNFTVGPDDWEETCSEKELPYVYSNARGRRGRGLRRLAGRAARDSCRAPSTPAAGRACRRSRRR